MSSNPSINEETRANGPAEEDASKRRPYVQKDLYVIDTSHGRFYVVPCSCSTANLAHIACIINEGTVKPM
jgi:hypothetical protein